MPGFARAFLIFVLLVPSCSRAEQPGVAQYQGQELRQDAKATPAQNAQAKTKGASGAVGTKASGKTATGVSGEAAPAAGGEAAASSLACAAGSNGGRTDIGVSETKIRLATTAVRTGLAASLLADSETGMKMVINNTNRAGGICGRILELQVINDNFQADLGHQYLKNFLDPKSDIFAFAVVPSSEGLSSAIQSGDISGAGMPVIGTNGMSVDQYQDPWVWPVAAATVSTMRIIASYAYKVKAARSFGIVWDGKHKFGMEGAEAFRAQVAALAGLSGPTSSLIPTRAPTRTRSPPSIAIQGAAIPPATRWFCCSFPTLPRAGLSVLRQRWVAFTRQGRRRYSLKSSPKMTARSVPSAVA
jgi:hypothetical protein